MAYVKTVWATGDIITAALANHWETQYDAAAADLNAHKAAATLDHPDGSVTDAKIGNRTADQAQVPTSNTGLLGQFISWFANRIKAITGKTNWYDAPDTTLAAAKGHMDAAAPHSGHETPTGAQAKVDSHAAGKQTHGVSSPYYLAKTSRSDQLPAWGDIPDKPSTFPPSSHTHPGSDITSAVASANYAASAGNADTVDGKHYSDIEAMAIAYAIVF